MRPLYPAQALLIYLRLEISAGNELSGNLIYCPQLWFFQISYGMAALRKGAMIRSRKNELTLSIMTSEGVAKCTLIS